MIEKSNIMHLFDATDTVVAAQQKQDIFVPVEFIEELNSAKTKTALLNVYATWARNISQSDRCSVALDDGQDSVVNHALDSDFDIGKGMRHDITNTTLGEVAMRNRLLYIPSLSQIDLADTQGVHRMGYTAAILAPITTGGTCYGTLAISYRVMPDNPGPLLILTQAMASCLATQLLVIEQMTNLIEMARTDPLTGAENRYALYDSATVAWENWQNDQTPFSFVSVDVDHFKQVNDTYGHDVGDALLCAFVERLTARTRSTDSVIRIGGEEFGMLLNNADIGLATERAHRLCHTIGENSFAVKDMNLNITASFGVTRVLAQDQNFNDVLKRADLALYEAKAAGRDQVITLTGQEMAA